MNYFLGISVALAVLFIVNLSLAVFIAVFWRFGSRFLLRLSAIALDRVILGLRAFPPVAALIFVGGFLVPAFLLYEPANSGEVVSLRLGAVAGLCLIGVGLASIRIFRSWVSTRSLTAEWLRNSTELTVGGIDIPTHKIQHRFPVIAVVGVLRPKMFIADTVLESLTENEIQAAISHEYGHVKGRDNLKKTFLTICRSLLILPIGNRLDRYWAQNAEVSADEFASRHGRERSLDLASALVKISRIVPGEVTTELPAGAYIVSNNSDEIASRVGRLLRLSDQQAKHGGASEVFRFAKLAAPMMAVGLFAVHFADRQLLLRTHEMIEHFVRLTQ